MSKHVAALKDGGVVWAVKQVHLIHTGHFGIGLSHIFKSQTSAFIWFQKGTNQKNRVRGLAGL